MNPEQVYELARRPSDPPWWKLPNYDHDAIPKHGCFGKEHWVAMAAGRRPRG